MIEQMTLGQSDSVVKCLGSCQPPGIQTQKAVTLDLSSPLQPGAKKSYSIFLGLTPLWFILNPGLIGTSAGATCQHWPACLVRHWIFYQTTRSVFLYYYYCCCCCCSFLQPINYVIISMKNSVSWLFLILLNMPEICPRYWTRIRSTLFS